MNVLIAVDDSACSSLAITHVLEQCWPKGTEFRVLSVVEPVYLQYATEGGYLGPVIEAQQQFVEQTKSLVQAKLKELKQTLGQEYVQGHVVEGNAAECIMEMAKDWKADLIVLGSHGRRGLQRFFLGSVAEKVARYAPCSVEIVKAKLVESGNVSAVA